MKLTYSILCLSLLSLSGLASDTLSLDRIFNSRDFSSAYFGTVRWIEDGAGYTMLEASTEIESARELARYDSKTGKRSILLSAKKLIPEGQEKPLVIDDYHWSSDKSKLLIFTNSKRVWRYNTRGDYWVLNLNNGKLTQIGKGKEESRLMFAKFNPAGTHVGYVYKNNIYIQDLSKGKTIQLTKDGDDIIINGTSDWVYEEEFGLRDGFEFSPDGKRVAFWRMDASKVGTFYMINNTDTLYPELIPLQYPKAGTTNSAVKVGTISVKGGKAKFFSFEGDPRENYLPRMSWFPDSSGVIIQRMNRYQNHMQVFFGPANGGKPRLLFEEKNNSWIEVMDDLHFFDGGNAFTWVSEKGEWRSVYLYNRKGKEQKRLTPEEMDIISVEAINEDTNYLYFIASPESATERFLYRRPLDGSGKAERVTPADSPGNHRYQISPDQKWAVHTHNRFNQPSVYDVVSLPEHKSERMLVDNKEVIETINKLNLGELSFFQVDIGEVALDAWMIKPPHFNKDHKYPVLFFVYGEPGSQTVRDSWTGSRGLWHHYLAQQGYVVVSIDNRGTPGPRGTAFRKSAYKNIGILSSADQAAAAKKILEKDFIDKNNVAIWGWSGGGSQSLNAIFRYGDIYHTAMAVAPVADMRYYDTIYQERYTGLPGDENDAYVKGSPLTFAQNLEGNLLLIHGTGDDNVHYQATEVLINKLIEHNKYFTMLPYPNRAHGIFKGKNTRRHLFTTLTRYLMEHHPPKVH